MTWVRIWGVDFHLIGKGFPLIHPGFLSIKWIQLILFGNALCVFYHKTLCMSIVFFFLTAFGKKAITFTVAHSMMTSGERTLEEVPYS